jgi:CRISPR system Cascade subunit CasA
VASFNLITEPWIPCSMSSDGSLRELSLREVLARAPGIEEINDPSPLVTVALHRLLIAILHRNFGPKSINEWHDLSLKGSFDEVALTGYFDRWSGRFDLFSEQSPFYQCAGLDYSYERPISTLLPQLAAGNNATLFDHCVDDVPVFLSPKEAAKYVIAHQAFTVGGLISFEKGQDPKIYKSADAAPLTKGAVQVVKGDNLFRTLLLNMVPYDPEHELPFAAEGPDMPSWESDCGCYVGDRLPQGYLDLLTWQSRRIRLHPEDDELGNTVVSKIVIMKGSQFPDGFLLRNYETMLSYRDNPKAKPKEDPYILLGFREDKALWRDSQAVLGVASNPDQCSKVAEHLAMLNLRQKLARAQTLNVDLGGMSNDKSKVLFWRHERLPLPLPYLEERELGETLGQALGVADKAGRAVNDSIRYLAKLLLGPEADQPGGRQPDKDAVGQLSDSLNTSQSYWGRLEVPFKTLVVDLANDINSDGEYGQRVIPEWSQTACRLANESFRSVIDNLDGSGRSLKASARAERFMNSRLAALRSGTKQELKEGGDA